MENTKNAIQILTRIQLISSIVWAATMIVCALVLEGSYMEISLILISGYFVEFLLLNSSKNKLKKDEKN
jgi:hypothetical protein